MKKLKDIQEERKQEFAKIYEEVFGCNPFTQEEPERNYTEVITYNIYGIKANI